jgi:hypothetical protein
MAATGSAPLASTAFLTAGVFVLYDSLDNPYGHLADKKAGPLRQIKAGVRQLAAYLKSVGCNLTTSFGPTTTTTTTAENGSDAMELSISAPPTKSDASAADGPIKAASSSDANDEAEYVFC